ncbi:hypothetical protein A2634_02285 [Candidatus Amesbacteria bacterium RIFCSPHIGHO2_01_FULL_48_32]|uniref:Glycosyltransferase RgtA/B/C/D-like domain-containing protein n=1 Tax=Candidatus Amesbacteria bacterium RIFCSPLOWO2_01_FULL_48_25 TaxID=1797259 RepID=A0A1F4ZDN6_9BACT|nr:MAG: hypothetical protein A2634_02285 [Candidatus Amesbacteria bacterium RIFCSPHIGHO2_01_FULL_48_32]OGD04413.1 MAG: hypothetical protein A2989_05290 [Candidatus Amesbacteria bacterium RIFCSPLOWO2_01_FULL_48_25]HJZ06254.1 glycosyltransferase family 39 protein [Patescibacteria group bacterium]
MKPHLLLLLLFTITRLANLTLLPIFIDEANYLDWGWREIHSPNHLFYSLYDSKPPGIMWLYGLAQSVVSDPLLAGRLVTVFFGLLTTIGLYLISGPLAASLYTLVPIFVFFDRQALMETPLAAAGVWIYILTLRLQKLPTLKNALLLGFVLGASLLIKTNAILFALPIPFLLFSRQNLVRYWTLLIFALLGFLIAALPLFFQAQFWSTLSSNSRYSFTLSELLHFPILHWINNLWSYLQISLWHLTPLILITAIIGLRKSPKSLILYSLTPIALTILLSRSPTPRYIVSFLPFLLIPAAQFLSSHRKLLYSSLGICSLVIGIFIFSPPSYFRLYARLTPYSEIGYLEGDNSGYQVQADLVYLKTLKPPAIVALALNSGNPEAALMNYLRPWPGFVVSYLDSSLLNIDFSQADCVSSSTPLYFVARRDQQAGLEKFFVLVTTIKNPYNQDFNNIYTLRSDCPPEKTLNLTLSLNK